MGSPMSEKQVKESQSLAAFPFSTLAGVGARHLLIENTGLCFRFSSSFKKGTLTETSETAK